MTNCELPAPAPAEAEYLALQERLWVLLARQTELYTMGESTSVPAETARALLASITLSLKLHLEAEGSTPDILLQEDPGVLLRAGEAAVRRQVERARLQYARARRCLFQEENRSLAETLASIGGFFRAYDPRYFAAELPCDIDYQLCRSVPEENRGVLYLRAYLDCLLTEDAFLRRFSPAAVRRVLAVYPEHRELLINLYEPVADAALGLTLTEGDLFTLDMTAEGKARLTAMLSPLPQRERRRLLVQAGEKLARRLELGPAAAAYLGDTAAALLPRIEAVLAQGGDWQPLFPAFC